MSEQTWRAAGVKRPVIGGKNVAGWGKAALGYLGLIVMGLVFTVPLIWTLSASLKRIADIWVFPPQWIPPRPWLWENYTVGLERMRYWLRFRYTVMYAGLTTLGTVLSSSFVAYGFSRLHFRGRDFMFKLMLSTMMLPWLVVMIPQFLIFNRIDWTNSYLPLVVPAYFGSAFYIFLLRQFYLTLPKELEDAAKIDGCSPLGTWWRIIMPISGPSVATVAILEFMSAWSNFVGPAIYLRNDDIYPLSLGLYSIKASPYGSTEWGQLMACTIAVSVPSLLIFAFGQRYIIKGAITSGLAGR